MKRKKTRVVGDYLIALVDLLNQSEALEKFCREYEKVKQGQGSRKGLRPSFDECWGRVERFREKFQEWYEGLPDQKPMKEFLKDLQNQSRLTNQARSDADIEAMLKVTRIKMKSQRFSDTLILYIPLEFVKDESARATSVFGVICTCAFVFLEFLAEGMVFRGGMEIGPAGEITEGDIYGPALKQAHDLESKEALYPRIVVGKGVCEYLEQYVAEKKSADWKKRYSAHMAEYARSFLGNDSSDGKCIVDYLGAGLHNWLLLGKDHSPNALPSARVSVQKAHGFVKSEGARFKAEKNEKLRHRYEDLMLPYFASRMHLWEPDK